MQNPILLLFMLLLTFSLSNCSKKIQLSLADVTEIRSSIPNRSKLNLLVETKHLSLDESAQIKFTEVVGTSDLNHIFSGKDNKWQIQEYSPLFNISLNIPSRKAKQINEIKGKIKVFNPSKEKKSKVVFNGIPEPSQRNLLGAYHKNIQLYVIDSIDFSSEIPKTKALLLDSLSNNSPSLSQEEIENRIEDLELSFDWLMQVLEASADNRINFIYYDPESKIVDIRVLDENGKLQRSTYTYFPLTSFIFPLKAPKKEVDKIELLPEFKSIGFWEQPKDNWTLEILIENKSSTTTYTFQLNNILLY